MLETIFKNQVLMTFFIASIWFIPGIIFTRATNRKFKNRKTWHHLHYKGYSDQYDSWEPEDDVVDLKDERLS